jgi:hypothetical protein
VAEFGVSSRVEQFISTVLNHQYLEITMALSNLSRRMLAATSVACLSLGLLSACAVFAPSQSVSLLEPVDGATVGTTFKVRFGVKGMAVAPAGDIVKDSGHNHLLINRMPVAAGTSVPFDDNHRHFGAGQTEAMITLPPGQYKLTSQFANGAHQSYGAPMSSSIQITVK